MDWLGMLTPLFTAIGGLIAGGSLMFYTQKKGKATAETVSSALEALKESTDYIKTLMASHREEVALLTEDIKEKENTIKAYREVEVKMSSDMQKLKYRVTKHERILKGLQNQITKEKSLKSNAEDLVCLQLDCEERIPTLGSFLIEEHLKAE